MMSLMSPETRDQIEHLVAECYSETMGGDSLYDMIRCGGIPGLDTLSDEHLLDEFEMTHFLDVEGDADNDALILYKKARAEIEIKTMLMGDNDEKTVQRGISENAGNEMCGVSCPLDCVADLNGNMVPRNNRVV